MNERWKWIARYLAVIAAAIVLAALLGHMELFKAARIGKTGLDAARIVQFLGYGAGLAVFWLLAQRAAGLLSGEPGRWSMVKPVIMPVATLIVVAAGQAVALVVLAPLMSKAWQDAYNWTAIAAIVLSAAWLLLALFIGSASLAPLFGSARQRKSA